MFWKSKKEQVILPKNEDEEKVPTLQLNEEEETSDGGVYVKVVRDVTYYESKRIL